MPVVWVSYPEPLATQSVILNNNQRHKTTATVTREALYLEDTARKMARERQGDRTDLTSWSIDHDVGSGKWRDRVGKQLNISGKSVERGTTIFKNGNPDESVHEDEDAEYSPRR